MRSDVLRVNASVIDFDITVLRQPNLLLTLITLFNINMIADCVAVHPQDKALRNYGAKCFDKIPSFPKQTSTGDLTLGLKSFPKPNANFVFKCLSRSP